MDSGIEVRELVEVRRELLSGEFEAEDGLRFEGTFGERGIREGEGDGKGWRAG